MSELKRQRCTCCGRDFSAASVLNGVITCDYCGSVFTVARSADDRVLNFLDAAEHDLDTCHFDEALQAYKKAAELDKNEPEAYFGMALAKFKIQYLKDEVNNRLQPICHEVTENKFSDDKNYQKALKLATAEQRAAYENKAKEIDYIQGEFFKLKSSGVSYDCFICVKVTNDDIKTEDSKDADYIYHLLKEKGYKPFYSEYEIRNKQAKMEYFYSKDKTKLVCVPSAKERVDIPNSVTSIGEFAFGSCYKIESLTIPYGVTSIEHSAFQHCSNLTSISLPNSITSIGIFAFWGCANLERILIPDSVTSIDKGVFYGCENLTIYCRANEKPNDWPYDWNCYRPVVWGYTG